MPLLKPVSNTVLLRQQSRARAEEMRIKRNDDYFNSLPASREESPVPLSQTHVLRKIDNEYIRAEKYWTDYSSSIPAARETRFFKRQFLKFWLHRMGYSNNEIAARFRIESKLIDRQLKKFMEIERDNFYTQMFFRAWCKPPKLSL